MIEIIEIRVSFEILLTNMIKSVENIVLFQTPLKHANKGLTSLAEYHHQAKHSIDYFVKKFMIKLIFSNLS